MPILAPAGSTVHLVAIRRLAQRACDICGGTAGVARYRIEYLGKSRQMTVDLCGDHNVFLEQLAAQIPARRGARAGMMKRPVVTETQVKRRRT